MADLAFGSVDVTAQDRQRCAQVDDSAWECKAGRLGTGGRRCETSCARSHRHACQGERVVKHCWHAGRHAPTCGRDAPSLCSCACLLHACYMHDRHAPFCPPCTPAWPAGPARSVTSGFLHHVTSLCCSQSVALRTSPSPGVVLYRMHSLRTSPRLPTRHFPLCWYKSRVCLTPTSSVYTGVHVSASSPAYTYVPLQLVLVVAPANTTQCTPPAAGKRVRGEGRAAHCVAGGGAVAAARHWHVVATSCEACRSRGQAARRARQIATPRMPSTSLLMRTGVFSSDASTSAAAAESWTGRTATTPPEMQHVGATLSRTCPRVRAVAHRLVHA